MKFKASLTAAINASDPISVDGYDVEGFMYNYDDRPTRIRKLELSDGTEINCEEQEIEIDDGQAFFKDADGEEHGIIFSVSRRLQEGDIK